MLQTQSQSRYIRKVCFDEIYIFIATPEGKQTIKKMVSITRYGGEVEAVSDKWPPLLINDNIKWGLCGGINPLVDAPLQYCVLSEYGYIPSIYERTPDKMKALCVEIPFEDKNFFDCFQLEIIDTQENNGYQKAKLSVSRVEKTDDAAIRESLKVSESFQIQELYGTPESIAFRTKYDFMDKWDGIRTYIDVLENTEIVGFVIHNTFYKLKQFFREHSKIIGNPISGNGRLATQEECFDLFKLPGYLVKKGIPVSIGGKTFLNGEMTVPLTKGTE
ncbi:MAG: hypothetical protein GY804_08810 [Alphaproteobacteria bacterium]|nr:hypothetical protein [Alphaproteobacteria bacterium]